MAHPPLRAFAAVFTFSLASLSPADALGLLMSQYQGVAMRSVQASRRRKAWKLRKNQNNVRHGSFVDNNVAAALCHCIRNGGKTPSPTGDPEVGLELLLQDMYRNMHTFMYRADNRCTHVEGSFSGYEIEAIIYKRMLVSTLRTQNPQAANMFYIPTFTSCWRRFKQDRREGGKVAAERIQELVHNISEDQPYFRKYGGHRHFWVSSHDMGKAEAAALAVPDLRINASAVVNNADPFDPHNTWGATYAFDPTHDVPTPCNGDGNRAKLSLKAVQDPKLPRPYSVFFAGLKENKQKVRSETMSSFDTNSTTDPHVQNFYDSDSDASLDNSIIRSFSSVTNLKPYKIYMHWMPQYEYLQRLIKSDFCLAPRGSVVFSPRLFEAIWFGCIPVIVADNYYLPGSCLWDWSKMSVRIKEDEANLTATILGNLNRKWIVNARTILLRIRERFMWHTKEVRGDAFDLMMLDVFVKQQQSKCGSISH